MKIAFYCGSLTGEWGGTRTHFRELIKRFSKTDEIHIITGLFQGRASMFSPFRFDKPFFKLIRETNTKIHFLPCIKIPKLDKVILKIFYKPIMKFFSKTIITSLSSIGFTFYLSFFLSTSFHFIKNKYDIIYTIEPCIAGFITNIPIVFYNPGSGWLPPFFQKKIKKTISPSEFIKNKYEELTGLKSEVLPLGVDLKKFHKKPKNKKLIKKFELTNKVVLISVARLSKQKGHKYLLMAFKRVLQENRKVKLLIIGNGEEKEYLMSLSKKFYMTNNIKFINASDKELLEYYSLGDIFVLPSLFESFGIVFLEAMAFGLPIISTNTSAIPEIVNEKVGILVEPKNIEQLADAILKLVNDKKLRIRMSKHALEYVKQYDWDIFVKKLRKIFIEVGR